MVKFVLACIPACIIVIALYLVFIALVSGVHHGIYGH